MNEKHEFQVGDLVRLKSVEEILALGFSFNERGEIAYPYSKEVLLLNNELKHCDKEFVVDDFSLKGHAELNSTNSSVRIVNICPSVLELVEVEVEVEDEECHEELKVNPGDKVRIKSHWELIDTGWTFDGDNYFHSIDEEVIVKSMHKFLGEVYTVEKIVEGVIKLEEDYDYWNWTSYMIAEIVEENTYEDQLPTLKVGDKIRIKTHEELLTSGWIIEDDNYFFTGEGYMSDTIIVSGMTCYLGGIYTIEIICEEYGGVSDFRLEEDVERWSWTSYMVAEVIVDEEDTYRDEEGNPFDPNSDYIEEEEYQPYCAVVDEMKPTTWDKERIQRGFENLEMYHKGYADGFQRALELMKKEFGVE